MERIDCHMTIEELQNIVYEVDYNNNDLINYTEFLAATVSVRKFLTPQKLDILFRHFDIEGKDFVTK